MRKQIIILFCYVALLPIVSIAQQQDDIIGTWQTGAGNARVQVYKNGDSYQGKIVWLSEPIDPITHQPKTDSKHPDASLHQRPLLGLVNLWGFKFNQEKLEWNGGHIYDPKNGKEYKCFIKQSNNNTLEVRGYIGISLIGRTDTWKRVK
jgi:uncharacterized protein (DUF2147 family)